MRSDVVTDAWHACLQAIADAPKTTPSWNREHNAQYDHWAGRLSSALPPSHVNQTVAMIKDFREHYGEGTWLRMELNQLEAFEHDFGRGPRGELQYEDTSADGNADGAWESRSLVNSSKGLQWKAPKPKTRDELKQAAGKN